MARARRNSLGRFTSRAATPRVGARRIGAAGVASRRIGRSEPITGTEVDGVVSGEPIVFAPEVEPQAAREARTTKSGS